MLVIRHGSATGEASRALFAEYMDLVAERLGGAFVPTEAIFATEDDFGGAGGAWLVGYEGDVAVACGGLRRLAPGVAEIKRMFVTAPARGRGHARALLAELERLAAQDGCERVRLYTTEVLREARALYSASGYRPVGVAAIEGRIDLWLEKAITPRTSGLRALAMILAPAHATSAELTRSRPPP